MTRINNVRIVAMICDFPNLGLSGVASGGVSVVIAQKFLSWHTAVSQVETERYLT